jgi:hypothetical protein
LIWLLAASPLGTGCSGWNHPKPQLDSMAGLYDRASIVYRLDASQLCEPMAVARIEGQLVAYQELPTAPVPNSAVGTLTIKYPHPEGVPGCALAEVVIETRKPDGPDADIQSGKKPSKWAVLMSKFEDKKKKDRAYEFWTFDLPKSELDRAIGNLNETGYFTVAKVTQPGVDVAAQVDKREEHKVWRQVPELDAIMLHVRKSGQLVNYRRDPALAMRSKPVVTSVDAYRQITTNNAPSNAAAPLSGLNVPSGPNGPGNVQLSRLPDANPGLR